MYLIPGTSHNITWSVQNLQDTATYYVKAVVRDLRTETILATLYLTDLGSNRFSKSWNVPQDPTGFGRLIEIEKTVYTDSAYTVPSEIYGRWLDQYMIFNLGNRMPSTGGYGGGGSNIDYNEIAKIIRREVDAAKVEILTAENEGRTGPTDLSEVLQRLQDSIGALSGLSSRISGVENVLRDYKGKLPEIAKSIALVKESLQLSINDSKDEVTGNIAIHISNLEDALARIESAEKSDMLQIEGKMDDELKRIMQKLSEAVDAGGKQLKGHVEEAMKKPLNVTLAAQTVPEKAAPTPNPREESIKRMLNNNANV